MREDRRMATDGELLATASNGDIRAFGVLYLRYRDSILAYSLRMTRNPGTAADLMAETFAVALVAATTGKAGDVEAPAPWLFRIARNKLIDAERRGRVDAAARQSLSMQPLVLEDRDLAAINELGADDAVLAALPKDLAEAVRARVIEDLEYWEIARSLGCSEMVVRKRVSRGLIRLRMLGEVRS
jgi:RNA polymerase sigma factor (sigma-70 family)